MADQKDDSFVRYFEQKPATETANKEIAAVKPVNDVSFYDSFGLENTPEPKKVPGIVANLQNYGKLGQYAQDFAAGVGQVAGDVSSAGSGYEIARSIKGAAPVSDDYLKSQQEGAARLESVKNGSFLDKAIAVGKNIADAPGHFIANTAGSLLPYVVSRGAAPSLMATQSLGGARQGIYDNARDQYEKQGLDSIEASKKAEKDAELTGKNAGNLAANAGLGYLAGKFGNEGAVARLAGRTEAAAAEQIAKRGLGATVARETALQGGISAAQAAELTNTINTASNQAGFDPANNRDITTAALEGGLAGALPAPAFGIAGRASVRRSIAENRAAQEAARADQESSPVVDPSATPNANAANAFSPQERALLNDNDAIPDLPENQIDQSNPVEAPLTPESAITPEDSTTVPKIDESIAENQPLGERAAIDEQSILPEAPQHQVEALPQDSQAGTIDNSDGSMTLLDPVSGVATTLDPNKGVFQRSLIDLQDANGAISTQLKAKDSALKAEQLVAIQEEQSKSVPRGNSIAEEFAPMIGKDSATDHKAAFELAHSDSSSVFSALKDLSARGLNLNAVSEGGETPLTRALSDQSIDVASRLIKAGADINATDSNGYTPLKKAVEIGDKKAISMLLKAGADTKNVISALKESKNESNERIAKSIEDEAARFEVFKKENMPLHEEISKKGKDLDPKKIADLIENASDVNAKDENGKTALDILLENSGDGSTLNSLMKAGANPTEFIAKLKNKNHLDAHENRLIEHLEREAKDYKINRINSYIHNNDVTGLKSLPKEDKANFINEPDNDGYTPLERAAESSSKELIQQLLKDGADASKIHNNSTPLMDAIYFNNVDAIPLLMEGAGKTDSNGVFTAYKDKKGLDSLMQAAVKGNPEVAHLLVDKFDITDKSNDGKTAEDYARMNDHDAFADIIASRRIAKEEKDALENLLIPEVQVVEAAPPPRKSRRLSEEESPAEKVKDAYSKEELSAKIKEVFNAERSGLGDALSKIVNLKNANEVNATGDSISKRTQGFAEGRQATLVPDQISKTADIKGLVEHELGVHALRLGKSKQEFASIEARFEQALKNGNAKMKQGMDRVPENTPASVRTEEGIAYTLEMHPDSPFAVRVAEWFRQSLRELAKGLPLKESGRFYKWVNELSVAELQGMAKTAMLDHVNEVSNRSNTLTPEDNRVAADGTQYRMAKGFDKSDKVDSQPKEIALESKSKDRSPQAIEMKDAINKNDSERVVQAFKNLSDKQVGDIARKAALTANPDIVKPFADKLTGKARENLMSDAVNEAIVLMDKSSIENLGKLAAMAEQPIVDKAFMRFAFAKDMMSKRKFDQLLPFVSEKALIEFKNSERAIKTAPDLVAKAEAKIVESVIQKAIEPESPAKTRRLSEDPNDNSPEAIRNRVAEADKTLDLEFGKFQEFQTKYVNMFAPLRNMVTRAEKILGRKIADEKNPMFAQDVVKGKAANRFEKFKSDYFKPIAKEMKDNDISFENMSNYLHARHAIERNAAMEKINPGRDDNKALSGLSNEDAIARLGVDISNLSGDEARKALLAKNPSLEKAAQLFDKMVTQTRDLLVETGLESKETAESWGKQYEFYAPLQRVQDEDAPQSRQAGPRTARGSTVKAATGSTRAVDNILYHAVMDANQVIQRASENEFKKATAAFFKQYDKKGEVAKLDKFVKDSGGDARFDNMQADGYQTGIPNKKVISTDENGNRIVDYQTDTGYMSKPNVVPYRVNGKDYAIVFNDKSKSAMAIANAFKNVNDVSKYAVIEYSGKVTNYISRINTSYNPFFGIKNLIRDAAHAQIAIQGTALKGSNAELAKNQALGLKVASSFYIKEAKGKKPLTNDEKLFAQMKEDGVGGGYSDQYKDSSDAVKKLQGEINPTAPRKVAETLKTGLDIWNDTLENGTRFAIYKTALSKNMSREAAASLASNLTINFNHKGTDTALLNKLYGFFNASVQGTASLGRVMTVPGEKGPYGLPFKLSDAGKQIIIAGITAGIAQAALNESAGFEEGDIPENEKAKNLIIPTGDKKYLTIPMAQGFSLLPTIGRLAYETVKGGKPSDKLVDLLSSSIDSFSPIGGSGSFAQTLAPTALDPVVALASNTDGLGRPIARQDLSGDNPTPGFTRTKNTATAASKFAAELINSVSGGTEFKPGKASPTPDQIDFVLGVLGGGVLREGMRIEQAASSAISGENLEPNKTPLLSGYAKDAASKGAVSNQYHNNVKKLNGHKLEITGRRESGQSFSDYISDNPDAKLIPFATNIDSQIKELNQQKKMAIKRENKDQVKTIEERITDLQLRLNERIKEVSKK